MATANATAMCDHRDVQRMTQMRRNASLQLKASSVVGVGAAVDPAQSLRNPPDVRIHRQYGSIKRVHKHAASYFRSNTGEGLEVIKQLFCREGTKMPKRSDALFAVNLLEHRFKASGPALRKTSSPNDRL